MNGTSTFTASALAGLIVLLPGAASAQVAPDPTGVGPLATTSSEYRFPPSVDPNVLPGVTTEIWARVYRPTTLSDAPYPLLIFLHGNHGTCGMGNPRNDSSCQYTSSGTCPAGFIVTPNHNGYGYLADRLASWGYVVVSINANRGITCSGGVAGDAFLIQARGRLVLRHLELLSQWNRMAGTTPVSLGLGTSGLQGRLDFGSVGLMGHSRGGEGVRTAYNMYRAGGSPWPARIVDLMTIQGIFEIGPVDGQNPVVQNADGTRWGVLLPMCDGDVSDLQGVRAFDRTIRVFNEDYPNPKATFTVWGANHNFYNTEWQLPDSSSCTGHTIMPQVPGGSPNQRTTGLEAVNGFFRATVFGTSVAGGYNSTFMQNFNPQFGLPPVASVTRIDRGFTESADFAFTNRVEDFQGATGTNSPWGVLNQIMPPATIIHGTVPNHDGSQRAGLISWTAAGGFFQANWTNAGIGRDVRPYATLDVRASRQNSGLNPPANTNFSIRLVRNDGMLSAPVQINAYLSLAGPVGGPGGLHPILQTARIPLTAFGAFDLQQVRGVRFTFDGTASGAIYLGDIRMSQLTGSDSANLAANEETFVVPAPNLTAGELSRSVASRRRSNAALNTVNDVRNVADSPALGGAGVEIELYSSDEFPVRNEAIVMRIGSQDFVLSRYADDGDTHTLIFSVTPDEFDALSTGDPISVRYGRDDQTAYELRDFGGLDKDRLN